MSETDGERKARGARSFGVAFLAGLAAGAVTALLCAPDKGANTRKRLAKGASSAYSRAVESVASTAIHYSDTASTARFQIDRLFRAVSAGLDEARVVRAQLDISRRQDEVSRHG